MILINTLSLAMKFYRQPEGYTAFLDVLNIIFTVFFTLEFVFKLGAFRFKVRNQFDGQPDATKTIKPREETYPDVGFVLLSVITKFSNLKDFFFLIFKKYENLPF